MIKVPYANPLPTKSSGDNTACGAFLSKRESRFFCNLSASQNIGARFFLRAFEKLSGCPELPITPQRTYATLLSLYRSMSA